MSQAEMLAELAALKQENAALRKQTTRGLSMKVSEKGGLSIYGLGRFPVTLYKEQWIKLMDMTDDVKRFMAAHDHELTSKTDTSPVSGGPKE